jgi:hypothetical protein
MDCPKGDIELVFCPVCGHIMNRVFDPSRVEYTKNYENPLDFSTTFQAYAKSLAEQLIDRYNLHNKNIISIGCGKATFLFLLCELGNNLGVGFDPAVSKRAEPRNLGGRIRLVGDSYSQKYADYPADFIVCRHVLEHIYNPTDFLKMLRTLIGKNIEARVFFEVPNAQHIFCQESIWDIIYEHCSYFSPSSLSYIFSSYGFRVEDIEEVYSNQFLNIHASLSGSATSGLDSKQKLSVSKIASCVDSFTAKYKQKIEALSCRLKRYNSKGERVVVWGAGSKGVMFLNSFKDFPIKYIVDINPHKQGMYIPGTGQQIVNPEFLLDYKPDSILLMNPIYMRETQQLTKNLGLTTKIKFCMSYSHCKK